MELDDYQGKCLRTAHYRFGVDLIYPILALCGEAGECANNVKKLIRDYGYKSGLDFKVYYDGLDEKGKKLVNNLRAELGDVLWYTAQSGYEIGAFLEDIAKENISKLKARHGV